jgi:exodeoxyribonuclease V gamma subunit
MVFEEHTPAFQQFAEREGDPALARAFADFDALCAGGGFERWAEALLEPLRVALGTTS